jgi:uncharacterized membrane protein
MEALVRGKESGRLVPGPLWTIPMLYTGASIAAGLILPRLERALLPGVSHQMAVGSALAYFSAVASGMMALTGIVFAIAFVAVQFSAIAYSPRLAVLFAGRPSLYHSLGIFFATFTYALVAMTWTDRQGSQVTPPISTYLIAVLLLVSLVAFARLIQSINDLQIHTVLQAIGRRGRKVVEDMYPLVHAGSGQGEAEPAPPAPGPAVQTLRYLGEPRMLAEIDFAALLRLAIGSDAVIALACGVGDSVLEGAVLLTVHGAGAVVPETALRRAVRLSPYRTFAQDPKYAIRLLVDVAIKALSPAVNDPTTAVGALDQIEDLLRRLGRRRLDAGRVLDAEGRLRVAFPAPTWEDYLVLSFDEIRQFGASSIQVSRRLRAALTGLAEEVSGPDRKMAVLRYLAHLDQGAARSPFDAEDRATALQQDRQGLGLSRPRAWASPPMPLRREASLL